MNYIEQHIYANLDNAKDNGFELNGLNPISDEYKYYSVLDYGNRVLLSETKILDFEYTRDKVMELEEMLCDVPLGEEIDLDIPVEYGINGIYHTAISPPMLFDFMKVGLIEQKGNSFFRTYLTVNEVIDNEFKKYIKNNSELVRKLKTF
jgi:hypothetical protein